MDAVFGPPDSSRNRIIAQYLTHAFPDFLSICETFCIILVFGCDSIELNFVITLVVQFLSNVRTH